MELEYILGCCCQFSNYSRITIPQLDSVLVLSQCKLKNKYIIKYYIYEVKK